MKSLRILLSTAVLLVFATALCSAHPTDGCDPYPIRQDYGTVYGDEYDMPGLDFVDEFQPLESLTNEEKIMVAGGKCADQGFRPWASEIELMVMFYYHNTGEMPTVFSEDIVRAMAANPENLLPEDFEKFKSPITGEFPRLDAVNFSPGEVYVHYLSEAELQHIASVDSGLATQLGEGGEGWELGARPIYIRVYGHSGVIYENITNVFVGPS